MKFLIQDSERFEILIQESKFFIKNSIESLTSISFNDTLHIKVWLSKEI